MLGLALGNIGITGGNIAAWSPLALWPDGASTPGLWISPRTLASSFADSTGTTPVATPGTVADSSNPVGLALDRKGGATALADPGIHLSQATATSRPVASARVNLLTYSEELEDWTLFGVAAVTPNATTAPNGEITADLITADNQFGVSQANSPSLDVPHVVSVYLKANTSNQVLVSVQLGVVVESSFTIGTGGESVGNGWYRYDVSVTPTSAGVIQIRSLGVDGSSFYAWGAQLNLGPTALPYQRVGAASDYDASAGPTYTKLDGVDDSLSSATFAAGTLTSGMDCLIAVRRDAGTIAVAGLNNQVANVFFGIYVQGDNTDATHFGCGAPVPYVDGVELTGGTSGTRNTLYNALTAGDWHILEYRGLDLSAWTQAFWGAFGASFFFNGPRGDILLYPSTASTEDKDAARQWLADYYGVTLA